MPPRLERRQTTGNFHFITFICHNRFPLLATPEAKNTFLAVLEQTRQRHDLKIAGYVLMPEHVRLEQRLLRPSICAKSELDSIREKQK